MGIGGNSSLFIPLLNSAAVINVKLNNQRGETTLKARYFDGVVRGVLIAESIWPNTAYRDGKGINRLTGADAPAPFGGAAFHDNRVAIQLCDHAADKS